jgi:predicted enzyme related to lactoylglutathione lyase
MDPVVHFEMPCDDRARVTKFYESVFGWKMKQFGEDMGNYITADTTARRERERSTADSSRARPIGPPSIRPS